MSPYNNYNGMINQLYRQNEKLDKIIFDIERKLEYQDKMLEKIWKGINKNGK